MTTGNVKASFASLLKIMPLAIIGSSPDLSTTGNNDFSVGAAMIQLDKCLT